MDKTYVVTFELEVHDDDQRSIEELRAIVVQALDHMPEIPYIDFLDLQVQDA